MINGQNLLNQPVKNNLITYDNIWNIPTGQEDDYTTGCLLDYNHFNNYYKMIAIGLSKQQALQQPLDHEENTTMFFIIEEVKEKILDFSQETVKVL